jgi:hypothetical protein
MGLFAVASVAVAALAAAPGGSAATPIGVVREVLAAAPGRMPDTVRCVARSELRMGDVQRVDRRTVGVTIWGGRTRVVLLDWRRICVPLHRFRTKARVQPADVVQALHVVLHEKAHVNGVRVEWRAECAALRPTLAQLRRWGYTPRQVRAARLFLTTTLDRARPSAYKLRGRCPG